MHACVYEVLSLFLLPETFKIRLFVFKIIVRVAFVSDIFTNP